MPDEVNDLEELQLEPPRYLSFEQFNTVSQYRLDWMQLILWLRHYTNSRIANSPDLVAAVDRLYQGVPLSFYNSLLTFYGPAISQTFSNLISRYIAAYLPLVEAQIVGDTETVNSITTELYNIMDEIAGLLASVNVYWSREIWTRLLHQYLSQTLDRMTAYLTGEYDLSIQIDDSLLNQAIVMGDYMARGIIANYGIQ